MNILVACEESQVVTIELRKLGFNVFSCDIDDCSGNHPEWHIKQDVKMVLYPCDNGFGKKDYINFTTVDGVFHVLDKNWDMIIAFPPCTYMSKAGARWMYPKAGELSQERYEKALAAKEFFDLFYNHPCEKIAIENPRPLKVVGLPKPSQVIQPYEYGHPYSKATCLWLKGLPLLKPTEILSEFKPYLPSNTSGFARGEGGSRGVAHDAKTASKTFKGVAKAMAEQWGKIL